MQTIRTDGRDVVKITHENGRVDFARIDYKTNQISGAISSVSVDRDIEKARVRLYNIVKCPYCNIDATLTDEKSIGKSGSRLVWLCHECGAYVYTHPNSTRHRPLGRLANDELRHLRKQVHLAFDPLWQKRGGLSRDRAYKLLRRVMSEKGYVIRKSDCHIGMFDEEQCRMLINHFSGGVHVEEKNVDCVDSGTGSAIACTKSGAS